MNNLKILYLASYDKATNKGVHNKIGETIKAAIGMGYESINLQDLYDDKLTFLQLVKSILATDAKFIILRSLGVMNIFLLPFVLIGRLQFKVFILDIPTPRCASYVESLSNIKSAIKKFYYSVLYCINGPWAIWPYNKIMQYGNESKFNMFGNYARTIIIGNGIDINRFPQRDDSYKKIKDELRIIGVAHTAFYHGYDRILKVMHFCKTNNVFTFKIVFYIVGVGNYSQALKEMVRDLDLSDSVIFIDNVDTDDLFDYYSKSHIAVSSISEYRRNLQISSVLKAREYCLVGIPFLSCGRDPDFPENCFFRYVVKNEDETESIIVQLILFLQTRDNYTDRDIRNYAIENLSFQKKLLQIGFYDMKEINQDFMQHE